ncbi:MAG TPA: PaaI family thioesterase [Syntrophorhabdaceae bacterium]|nr:PaaI family thioesterase [Syntrophorhabdaceae bacterium]
MKGLLPGYKTCFFCGPATGGLGLEMQCADGAVFCQFTANQRFEGYNGMMHGGIVAGILDEVMWWALFVETKIIAATTKMEIEYKRPVISKETYRARGQVLRLIHNTYHVSGIIETPSGQLCARANGYFRRLKRYTMEDIMKHLDFRGVPEEIRSFFQLP